MLPSALLKSLCGLITICLLANILNYLWWVTFAHVTAAIPVTPFEEKVFAHSANSIAVSKGTLDDGIKFHSNAKKSD